MNSLIADGVMAKLGLSDNSALSSVASAAAKQSDTINGIDWSARNFPHPRWCPVFHYDPNNDKLSPDALRLTARMLHTVKLVAGAWAWNFVSCVVLAAGGARSGLGVLYVCLFALFGLPLWLAAFYVGYKSVAAVLTDWKVRYMGAQGVLLAVLLIFVIANGGNVHGLTAIADASAEQQQFGAGLIAMSVIDSVVWLCVMVYGGVVLYRFHTYDVVLKHMAGGQHPNDAAQQPRDVERGDASRDHHRAQKAQRMADRRAKQQAADDAADTAPPSDAAAAEGDAPAAAPKKSGWRSLF